MSIHIEDITKKVRAVPRTPSREFHHRAEARCPAWPKWFRQDHIAAPYPPDSSFRTRDASFLATAMSLPKAPTNARPDSSFGITRSSSI